MTKVFNFAVLPHHLCCLNKYVFPAIIIILWRNCMYAEAEFLEVWLVSYPDASFPQYWKLKSIKVKIIIEMKECSLTF